MQNITNNDHSPKSSNWLACVGVEEAAAIFGWSLCFFPVLMKAGHLKPLRKPTRNAMKWFATCDLERLSRDPGCSDICVHLWLNGMVAA
jgi:hypothetical protein